MKLTIALFCASLAIAQPSASNPALEGLDPVLLTEGKEVPGLEAMTATQGRFLFRFSSAETRERFNKDPERYGIQLDGACARMGPPTGGSPDAYFVHEGRIYIFGSTDCYKQFSANPSKYLESGSKTARRPSVKELEEGRALLAKTVEAMGGAARFDAVHGYIETRKISGPQGGRITTNIARMPDTFLNENTFGENKFGNLVSASGAFNISRGEPRPLPPSFARSMRETWSHELLNILLARNARGVEVYSVEPGQVVIRHPDGESTLLIDPASSRVAAVKWRCRGVDGFGECRTAYSEYRETGGLQLPFRAEGTPRSWTIESYQLNPPDLGARLELPKK